MKSLVIIGYCSLFTESKQKKYGALSVCIDNIKKGVELRRLIAEKKKLGEETNATEEELQKELAEIDSNYIASFRAIPKELVQTVESELLPYKNEKGEEKKIDVLEVLAFLEQNEMVK